MNYNQAQWLQEKKLADLLKEEESEYIEKCESPKSTDKIAKAICAFPTIWPQKKSICYFYRCQRQWKICRSSVGDEMLLNIASIRSNGNLQPFPVIDIKKLSIKKHEIIAMQVNLQKINDEI